VFRLWQRFWLGTEDPRAIAAVRIVFGTLVICNINGLWEHFVFLFTDEGIFPADVARRVHAKQQFAGFGDGGAEPWGFFDLAAFVQFVTGPRLSLLYFWDSPTAMWIHVAAFELVTLMFVVGFWTRTSGVISFFLMGSLFDRNPLFWEGTDLVFRVFFVYLLFARTGHAWSVDNWLRCRRGADVVYRPIPVWPRRLMMLNLAALYLTTGALKSGSVWLHGDAVYYAMNLDHFYRFPTQQISAIFGTNLLKVATWFVHIGEIAFAAVFVGEVMRVALEGRPPTKTVRRLEWIRRWIFGRRIWITCAVMIMGGIYLVVNIGQFQTVMLALNLVYFRGEEIAGVVAKLGRRAPLPSHPERPWAYGRAARMITSGAIAWHIAAVGLWLLPDREEIAAFRKDARAVVRPWLEATRTTQGWGMFAPNPPRHNVFMKVLVTDQNGDVWDMRSDVYAPERKPIPFIWNDRMRKMNRRIIGGESGGGDWYRKWYARWQCRDWALQHGGVVPKKVELVKMSYRIPTPEQVKKHGWYRPEDRLRDHGKETTEHTEHCAKAPLGQPVPEVAARHGVESTVAFKPWITLRRAAWDARDSDPREDAK
jgi:hypothetical protein